LNPPKKAILANKIIYELKGSGYCAQGAEANEGFLVIKNSIARIDEIKSISQGTRDLRKKLIKSSVLQKSENGLHFTEDWLFNSPSAVASACSGKSANGLTVWKDRAGSTLKNNRLRANA